MDLSGSQFQDRKLLHRDPCCRIYCHNGPLQYLGLLHSQVQDSHLRLRQVGQVLLQLIFSYFYRNLLLQNWPALKSCMYLPFGVI